MTEIIGWLNLFVASVYAFLTYKIVKTSKEQSESVYRPYITITHHLSSKTLINLYIKNTGKTNANKLQLKIDKDYFQVNPNLQEHNIANNYAFTNIIETFPPDSQLKFALMSSVALHSPNVEKEGQPFSFTITATYSYSAKTVEEKTTIDLRPYMGTFLPDKSVEDKLEDLITELSEIKEVLKK